jgi:acyl phosphate:glycerol-3-phosphate acyltransferase
MSLVSRKKRKNNSSHSCTPEQPLNNFTISSICVVVASYLTGAVPFGLLIGFIKGVDIRTTGSGNIGATNVFRTLGKPLGITTFILDALKGFVAAFFLPVIACGQDHASGRPILAIICACAAVAGHNWPVYLKFKGGKGVATSAGALLGIAPIAMAAGLLSWVIVFSIWRYVSLGSIVASVIVPVAGWLQFYFNNNGLLLPITLTLLGILSIYRHKANIKRLRDGTESRIEKSRDKKETRQS